MFELFLVDLTILLDGSDLGASVIQFVDGLSTLDELLFEVIELTIELIVLV